MRVWATSDLHIDYKENRTWLLELSDLDFANDVLIIAGDITPDLQAMRAFFRAIVPKFHKVLFVPGNHDLWLYQKDAEQSLDKFHKVLQLANEEGVQTTPFYSTALSIVPIFSWYDFSFGQPNDAIKRAWQDFKRCRWENSLEEVTNYFLSLNEAHLANDSREIISFSHFIPDAALIPNRVPPIVKALLPVFGSTKIKDQLLQLQPTMHIYGHSHLNRSIQKDNIWYLNNALGYPHEDHICRRKLLMVYDKDHVCTGIEQWPKPR